MNKSTTTLQLDLLNAANIITPGSEWIHKKGGIYCVLGHVIDTNDGSVRVMYQRIGGPDFNPAAEFGIYFVRPIEEWTLDRFRPAS